jgi:hypothetical protein
MDGVLMGNRSRETRTKVTPARALATLVAVVVTMLGFGGGTAFADPPRPTDYRSEIVSITPDVPGMTARIIGGDAFLELDAPGLDVVVSGYQGEPYLHFAVDGTVSENQRSPARWLNTDRYSQTDVPPEADADAPPEWKVVGEGGRFAWHDHRTHWMVETPPLGLGPGDQILDAVIPIVVDGQDVTIAVRSVWMAPPSRVPWVAAALLAAAVGAAVAALGGRHPRLVAVGALVAAAAALVAGGWQTWSLPPETGPPFTHWVLPLVALAAAAVALVPRWTEFTVRSMTLIAGVQLAVWAVLRRGVLDHAILPTSAPFWLDRVLTAVAGVLAVVVVYASAVSIARLTTTSAPAASRGNGADGTDGTDRADGPDGVTSAQP